MTPNALIMRGLSPVALKAKPNSVENINHNKRIRTTTEITPTSITAFAVENAFASVLNTSTTEVIIVDCFNKGKFAFPPITRKLMEYKPVITKIPANNPGIFNFVCNIPVTNPATNPATKDNIVALKGFPPFTIHCAAIAAPKGKLPSVVKSAKSKTR